jgi:hypothetical protein
VFEFFIFDRCTNGTTCKMNGTIVGTLSKKEIKKGEKKSNK